MKFISSSYDPEKGISIVTMQHFGKKFVGIAKIHPDEKDRASEFAGCEYAEIKATIKALKYERKLAKAKADSALDFIKSCSCYKNFDLDNETGITIKRQLAKRIQRVNDITDEINSWELELNKRIISRKAYFDNITKLKKTKEDN